MKDCLEGLLGAYALCEEIDQKNCVTSCWYKSDGIQRLLPLWNGKVWPLLKLRLVREHSLVCTHHSPCADPPKIDTRKVDAYLIQGNVMSTAVHQNGISPKCNLRIISG